MSQCINACDLLNDLCGDLWICFLTVCDDRGNVIDAGDHDCEIDDDRDCVNGIVCDPSIVFDLSSDCDYVYVLRPCWRIFDFLPASFDVLPLTPPKHQQIR